MDRDAAVLSTTGILYQGRDASGVWRTVRQRYPREYFDEFVVDTLDQGPVRMVFVGGHDLRYVGRIIPSAVATPQSLNLLAADHSRLGDVRAAVARAGGATTSLTPGDTLKLSFAATPVPAGQVRDFFLLSRGVYTSIQPPSNQRRSEASAPASFALIQNRPNPFSRATNIEFQLPRPGMVHVDVFDMQGRLIRKLADRWYEAGKWSVEWDRRDTGGNPVPAAIYLYRMTAGSFREQRKMVLLAE